MDQTTNYALIRALYAQTSALVQMMGSIELMCDELGFTDVAEQLVLAQLIASQANDAIHVQHDLVYAQIAE